jgi:copper chaperone
MIQLTLPTMTCQHCVRTVTEAIRALDPAATVQIDLPQHTLQVVSTQTAQAVAAALAEAGYVAV